ncbi:uncharacterized protein F4822DRAFT_424457 [Hypoxylon trugodes]|uniref:uncharacterized protein n=1 Tax=Hypoxylon trugodes TaxID=326681 RepID=UPI00219E2D9A|nr:uncharacterized protein F4822DRAFT_424457 [Hypoxylon trugodes]KAI1394000.1 hypothetical protein F4822DRAFT_424457 [Hypoxylon trugodes]
MRERDSELEGTLRFMSIRNIKSVSLFEDTNQDIDAVHPCRIHDGYDLNQSTITPNRVNRMATMLPMDQWLAKLSLNLECLSMSFVSDAKFFFRAVEPVWIWNDLEQLSLTSHVLRPVSHPDNPNDLLIAAAHAALRMSRLRIMELWYTEPEATGTTGYAGVFRYQRVSKMVCTITWDGTWSLPLEPSVVQAWNEVALTYTEFDIRVREDRRDAGWMDCRGDAIKFLGLQDHVVSQTSLEHMVIEAIPR